MDMYTNFFCITLTNKFATKFYFKICGCIHNFCWNNCLGIEIKQTIQNIHSTSPALKNTTTSLSVSERNVSM